MRRKKNKGNESVDPQVLGAVPANAAGIVEELLPTEFDVFLGSGSRQGVQLVPMLDEASFLDPPDVDRAHGEGITGRGVAEEVSGVRTFLSMTKPAAARCSRKICAVRLLTQCSRK
jgi:hypothetical protein